MITKESQALRDLIRSGAINQNHPDNNAAMLAVYAMECDEVWITPVCSYCHGSGMLAPGFDKCPRCNGKGV